MFCYDHLCEKLICFSYSLDEKVVFFLECFVQKKKISKKLITQDCEFVLIELQIDSDRKALKKGGRTFINIVK